MLVFLVLAGATNGVNLTDGLDGLAAGCGAIVLLTYTAIAFITGGQDGLSITEQDGLSLLGACLVGASIGFLWFNSFPAAIFMGDTGSLGLGGAIAGMAVMTKSEVLLIVIGGIFVIEALSVAAQVFTFRVFRRRDPADGADPPPLRAARLVGDEDHRALLDHGRDRERDRLHALPAEHRSVSRRAGLTSRRPYLVVGLARSGVAAALALRAADARARGRRLRLGRAARGRRRAAKGLRRRASKSTWIPMERSFLPHQRRRGRSSRAPGCPLDAPVVAGARERGIDVVGELELGWRMLPNEFCAVTGTNGKTTTTELLGAIYRAAGLPVAVAGQRRHAGRAPSPGELDAGRDRRLRGLELPARGQRRVRARGGASSSTSPRTTSTATRRSTTTSRPSCGCSRTSDGRTSRS